MTVDWLANCRRSIPLLLLVLLVGSCASKPDLITEAPHWSEVPGTVVEAFCSRRHDEGISPEITINVVRTTRPLVTAAALRGLAAAASSKQRIDTDRVAAAIAAGNATIEVNLPSGGCAWRRLEVSSMKNAFDTMTLELSAPLLNPFARSSAGLLARLSLSGQGTTWYWLPVAQRGSQGVIGSPMPLNVHD